MNGIDLQNPEHHCDSRSNRVVGARKVANQTSGRPLLEWTHCRFFHRPDGVCDTRRVGCLNNLRRACEVDPGPIDRLDKRFNIQNAELTNPMQLTKPRF